ncbi:MAG TPA: hypothetical protein VMR33_04310 [Candidatus Baltobacteraceae bacterium]|jgi:hypothetical protein|nr:hypothetical protein [Candidatus Baltobacteraceae bacterium]
MNKISTTRRNAVISTVGLVLALTASAAFAQQELIVNGSFESGAQATMDNLPGWGWVGPADNNSDYGVAESSLSPDVAEQGSFFAYFHGHPTDGSQDCLGQTVNLTVGAQYTVSYYLATDGTTLGSGAAMWAVIGTSFGIDYSQDVLLTAYTPNSSNALPYQKFTTNITATTASEILSFHGIDATSSILLDNVSMTLALPSGPQLNLGLSGTNTLVFTWTAPTNGYLLQASASPFTTNWVTLTNAPVTVGSSNHLVLPVPGSNQFYRLTLP